MRNQLVIIADMMNKYIGTCKCVYIYKNFQKKYLSLRKDISCIYYYNEHLIDLYESAYKNLFINYVILLYYLLTKVKNMSIYVSSIIYYFNIFWNNQYFPFIIYYN